MMHRLSVNRCVEQFLQHPAKKKVVDKHADASLQTFLELFG